MGFSRQEYWSGCRRLLRHSPTPSPYFVLEVCQAVHALYAKESKLENEFDELYSSLFKKKDAYIEGNGTPLQYSCLENPMDRGAW